MLGKPQDFMKIALEEAKIAASKEEFPVGAVIVHNHEILARTHNLNRTLSDPTAHAEILALREAGKKLKTMRLENCDLYVTLEPCPMCAGAISHARIRNLYYALEDPKGGAVSNNTHFFTQKNCFHKPDIYYPFLEKEARELLETFVKKLRS